MILKNLVFKSLKEITFLSIQIQKQNIYLARSGLTSVVSVVGLVRIANDESPLAAARNHLVLGARLVDGPIVSHPLDLHVRWAHLTLELDEAHTLVHVHVFHIRESTFHRACRLLTAAADRWS